MDFESLNKKPNPKELIEIYIDLKGDDEYSEYAIAHYEQTFKDFESDNDYNNEDDLLNLHDYTLFHCLRLYVPSFLKIIRKGHSAKWADRMYYEYDNGDDPFITTYHHISKENPELALKEITLHCNLISKDEIFQKYYLFLIENQCFKRTEERTIEYVQIYKEQIARGKSAVYAHEYCNLMSSGIYHNIFCEEYAYAYDKAINEGKSESYARKFAQEYGDALVDIKTRYGISEDEKLIDFAIEKVNVYMTVWEYNEEHKLKDFKSFAAIYEKIHFDTYYTYEISPEGIKEEIDLEILEKALKQYNK
jgi:hypothetical protein